MFPVLDVVQRGLIPCYSMSCNVVPVTEIAKSDLEEMK